MKEIRLQLGMTRLLTLTGPGGIGKTRLALKIAEDAIDDFQNGCFFVSLAPIHSVDHIAQSVAEALNFPLPTNEDPKYQLLRYLQKKNLLLIMDNFEHLMDGAGIVGEILQSTSRVKVLATSRERLNLKSETALSIAGMSGQSNDAVTLFLQSGARAQPGFEPASDELIQIENICRIVGGMPLAIELAASWLHVLAVNEINDELQKGLDILETEVRDAPERHRSIRAVFDESWLLLDSDEREIFMRLSIFRGGFTREAAQQIAGASLRQIAGLVNKSILRHDPKSGRLEIHEVLRQYAQEQLEKLPHASESTKETYAEYYADFMQKKWKEYRGHRAILAITEIEADIENVRAAWRYYLDQKNASQLLKFIYGFWAVNQVRGWGRGAIELFAGGVDALGQAEYDSDLRVVRAISAAFQGYFMAWVGLAEEGYKLIRESIEALEALDHPIELAFAYASLSLAAYYLNRSDEERDAAQNFLGLAQASKDPWLLAYGFGSASHAEFGQKNYAESKRLAEAALELSDELNYRAGAGLALLSLGQLAIKDGDFGLAKGYFTRMLVISTKSNYFWISGGALKYLGEIAILTGDIPDALNYLTRSLRIAYDLGVERDIANNLFDFASLRLAQNRLEEGVELLSLLLQQPASHLARAGGGSIRDRARTLLAEFESRLSDDAFEAALQRGRWLNLDDVVTELLDSE